MYNEAKKASNERYLSKFKTVTLRLLPAELDGIQAAAATAGSSVAGYILGAVRERMEGTTAGGGPAPCSELLTAAAVQVATAAADLAGETVPEWIERAVVAQQAADQRAEELRRLLANKEK